MVQFHRYAPSEALRLFIACLEVIQHNGPAHVASAQRVTPDGCMELNFKLGAPLCWMRTAGSPLVLNELQALHQCFAC